MGFSFLRQNVLSALMTLSGAALVIGAPRLGRLLRTDDLLFPAATVLWGFTVAVILWRGARAGASLARWLTVAVLFTAGAFPFTGYARWETLPLMLALPGLLLLAAGLAGWQSLHPFLARLAQQLRRLAEIPRWVFLWGMYTAFLLLTVFLSWHCFHFLPTIIDSISQYVHGKFIAEWQWVAESHTYRGFFPSGLMINDGKWYSQYQPLHVMLLALGHVLHTPWLVNPLLGALTLVATYALARRIAGEATAHIAALLMLACPFVVFMSSEYMNHATSLLFTTTLMLCYVSALQVLPHDRSAALWWSLGAGLSLGAVFLTRPLTALGVGLPFVLHGLYLLARQPRAHLALFSVMAGGGLICLAFQIYYNLQTTGEALLFPYQRHNPGNLPGFYSGHTPLRALEFTHRAWLNLNRLLFEWAVPDTLFVFLAFLLPLKGWLRLLVAVILSAVLVNFLNRYHSSLFGPRYMYEIASALAILSAVGLSRLPEVLERWGVHLQDRASGHGIAAVLLLFIWGTGWAQKMPDTIRHYANNYVNGNPGFYYSMLAQAKPPALVFIEYFDRPVRGYKFSKYLYVAHTNPPKDDAPVIFAIDLGEKNRRLMEYYPLRNVYIERGGQLRLEREGALP